MVALRKTKYIPNANRFCVNCLSSSDGARYQLRFRNKNCTYDLYLCSKCFKELLSAMEAVNDS